MKVNRYLLVVVAAIMLRQANGQEISKRFAFAKAYFCVNLNYTPDYGLSRFITNSGQLEGFETSQYLSPSINIGANRFWEYADIYVSIATANIFLKDDNIKTSTRFRIYPWQLKDHVLRPYFRYKFAPLSYKQETLGGENFKVTKVKSVLDIGISYRLPNFYFYAGYNDVINPEVDIHVSRTRKTDTNLPNHFFNLGINWIIETTNASTNKVAKSHFNTEFAKSNQHGLFFGIGLSSAFQTGASEYNNELRLFWDNKSQANIFPDFSMGYHFTKIDIIAALAYRPITQKREAFDFSQKVSRNSFVLEAYKFIEDYHGFVPFIGGGASYESLKLREVDGDQEVTSLVQNKLNPVVTFGWDIRPPI